MSDDQGRSVGYFRERAVDPHQGTLTPAELDVTRLLSHGYSLRMIAEQRVVSINTVKTQLATGQARVSAKTRAHLVAIALRTGQIQ